MKRTHWQLLCCLMLAGGAVATGATLVMTTHESRRLFAELEELRREQDRLQDDWSALRIEASQLADHAKIDRLARDEFGMVEPVANSRYVEVHR